MLEITIPGFRHLTLEHLVMDYNGTLALDGQLMLGVKEELKFLAELVTLHVVTADTNGGVADQLAGLPVRLSIVPEENQAEAKLAYIRALGPDRVAVIGNGRNDRLMISEAALGIALLQKEGAATASVLSADIVSTNLLDAFNLLSRPNRLISTLRS